jgi:hypothetical protein
MMTFKVSECKMQCEDSSGRLTVSSEQDTDDRVVLGDTQT